MKAGDGDNRTHRRSNRVVDCIVQLKFPNNVVRLTVSCTVRTARTAAGRDSGVSRRVVYVVKGTIKFLRK